MFLVRFHPDLRRYVLFIVGLGILLAIVGVACLLVVAGAYVELFDAAGQRRPPDWAMLIFAALMFGLTYLCVAVVPRWYRRSSWVHDHVKPIQTRIVVRCQVWSNSTDWYLELPPLAGAASRVAPEHYAILRPRWDAEPLCGQPLPARVYFDPETREPALASTEHGVFWVVPRKAKL